VGFDAFLASIVSEDLRKVAKHWRDARAGRVMPGWNDLRPSKIANQLPLIWVYRYDRAADSFTGRLAGDTIEQIFGQSFRSTPMSVLYANRDYSEFFQRCKRVVCEPALCRGDGRVFRHVDRYGDGERIILPLADDGVTGNGIFGATIYNSFGGTPSEEMREKLTWFALDR
jgi:hypothetical protein